MTCAAESTWAAYVDHGLAPEDVRLLEAHLVGCRTCRALVVALGEETSLLETVLREEPSQTPTAPSVRTGDPGLTWAVPLTIGAVAATMTALGALAESHLPSGFDFLNPLRLKGAYEMAFDLFFLLRDEAPAWFDFALSLAATGSVAGLATLAVSILSRRLIGPGLMLLAGVSLGMLPQDAAAVDLRFDQDTRVTSEQTIAESLVATGDLVDIDGLVEGDLLAATERLSVRGTVDGDLYVFAREVEIQGTVTGSVHIVSERVRITGEVGGSLISGSERFTLASGALIQRDAAFFGDHAALEGNAGRDVVFLGDTLEVRGRVARDLDVLRADRVAILEGARVAGDLDVGLDWNTEVEVASGAIVGGEVRKRKLDRIREHHLADYSRLGFYIWLVVQMAGGFLFGLLLHALAPQLFEVRVGTHRHFFRALGVGFLFALATPVVLLVTAVTVVGIPAAVLGLFIFVVALYVSHILVAVLLGRTLLRGDETGQSIFIRRLLLGIVLVGVATHLPFLGPPVFVVVLLLGLGLLVERGRSLRIVATEGMPRPL